MLENLPVNTGNSRDVGSIPGLGRYPGEGNSKPTPGLLPGESHGRRSLVGYSPRGRKESGTTARLLLRIQMLGESLGLQGDPTSLL